MVLVDTNILVHAFLDGPQTALARKLIERDDQWRSESYVLVELSNVLVTVMRVRGLALSMAERVWAAAHGFVAPGLVEVAEIDAMRVAQSQGTSAYDARFLVAARELGLRLTTEDTKLRRAAPELTQSLDEALAGA